MKVHTTSIPLAPSICQPDEVTSTCLFKQNPAGQVEVFSVLVQTQEEKEEEMHCANDHDSNGLLKISEMSPTLLTNLKMLAPLSPRIP